MYEFRRSSIEKFANVISDLCNCAWRWNGQAKKNRLNAHHLSWYKASVHNAYHSITGIRFEGASSSSIYILCLALEICWIRGKCESKDRFTVNDFLVKSTSNARVLSWTLRVDNNQVNRKLNNIKIYRICIICESTWNVQYKVHVRIFSSWKKISVRFYLFTEIWNYNTYSQSNNNKKQFAR